MSLRPTDLTNKNPNISTIASLNKGPCPEQCLRMLYSLSHKVSKLMEQKSLKINQLQEFHPKQENLLGMNVNKGHKVLLRLRHKRDIYTLMDEESVMDTFLHELVHNTIGPHNDKFNKLWDDFRQQQWGNLTLGLYNNFLGEGKTLGGGMVRRSIPLLKVGGKEINLGKGASEMAKIAALQRFEETNLNFCSGMKEEEISDDDLKIIHLNNEDELKEIIILDSDSDSSIDLKEPKKKKQKTEPILANASSVREKERDFEIIQLSD